MISVLHGFAGMTEVLLAVEIRSPVYFYNAIVLHLCYLKEHRSAKYSSGGAQPQGFNQSMCERSNPTLSFASKCAWGRCWRWWGKAGEVPGSGYIRKRCGLSCPSWGCGYLWQVIGRGNFCVNLRGGQGLLCYFSRWVKLNSSLEWGQQPGRGCCILIPMLCTSDSAQSHQTSWRGKGIALWDYSLASALLGLLPFPRKAFIRRHAETSLCCSQCPSRTASLQTASLLRASFPAT